MCLIVPTHLQFCWVHFQYFKSVLTLAGKLSSASSSALRPWNTPVRKWAPCYTSSPSRFQNEFLDAYVQPVSLLHSGTAISRKAIIRPLPFLSFSAAIYFGVFVPGGRGLWPSTWPLSLDREEEGEKRKECRERGRNAGRPKKRRALWERKEAEEAGGARFMSNATTHCSCRGERMYLCKRARLCQAFMLTAEYFKATVTHLRCPVFSCPQSSYIIHCFGFHRRATLWETQLEKWRDIYSVNLQGSPVAHEAL